MLELIVIVLVFVRSIVRHYSRLCRTVVLDRLLDCSIRRLIAFGFTKPLVSILHSLIFDLWLFDCSRPIVWPIVWLFAVLPNRCPWSVAQLLLAYCLACRSIVLDLYMWIVLDYRLFELQVVQDKIYCPAIDCTPAYDHLPGLCLII